MLGRMWRRGMLAGLILLQGCGGAVSSGPSAPAGPPAVCPSPPDAIGPGVAGSLQESDRDRTVCIRVGEEINAFLRIDSTDQSQRWSPIAVRQRAVLEPVPNGRMTLPLGVTAGFFKGVAAGSATLSSAKPPCAPEAVATCPSAQRWQVTVWVTS